MKFMRNWRIGFLWHLPRSWHDRGLIWPLFLLMAVVCGVWAFGAILSEVLEGDTAGFDRAVLLAMRTPGDLAQPIGPPQVQEFMRDVSGLGGVGVLGLLTLASVVFLAVQRLYQSALFVVVSVGLGTIISAVFKMIVARPRPDLVPHGAFVDTASFPSGHSMMSAVVYLTLAVMLAQTQTRLGVRLYMLSVATLLTLGVGVARVYLGVHWPTDVMAGWALGAAWAILCAVVAGWMAAKGQIETVIMPTRE
jgi:undecaprenyl-diphosphatase